MRPTPDDILESATTLVEATLALNILDTHKRDVINAMLWKITEARGKYTTRFRSTGAGTHRRVRSCSMSTSFPERNSSTRSCMNRRAPENS